MAFGRLALPALLALSFVRPAPAETVMEDVHADRWADAAAAAAQYADPVALKLVTFYRLLAPHAASVTEIADFMAQNADWPFAAQLAKRRDEALAADSNDAEAAQICVRVHPESASALLRCADAESNLGEQQQAATAARRAWLTGIDNPADEQAFLKRWAPVLSEADQWHRFDRLVAFDLLAATRQAERLGPADRAAAEARLALRRKAPNAAKLLDALTPGQRANPEMFLDHARWLRQTGQEAEALVLWKSGGDEAERTAPAERLAAFWAERNHLGRDLLSHGDAAGAYAVVAGHHQQAAAEIADAEFLAGFIALRWLHDPALAARHFAALAEASKSVISEARAHYWLGRADAARGDAGAARTEYAAAAGWPTTFYGQLAALALGEGPAQLNGRILGLPEPGWDSKRVIGLVGREMGRAALLLIAWGEPLRARTFLMRLDAISADDVDRTLSARLALELDLPETAVAIARRAGRDGLMLADCGWPMMLKVPEGAVPPALTLALIRQESSFDPGALSPAGARGLMQLMPATAETVARRIGVPVSLAGLTTQTSYNMQLGTAYLRELLDRYGGALPLALAAYNAGPHKVDEWLAQNSDPRAGKVDMIDWIELIGFSETRNYVQRVIESMVIYRAKRHEALPHPLAPWLH
jgi:soluble lytic murein transglycosylase